MVVITNRYRSITIRNYFSCWRWINCCAVHLYFILMEREKQLESLIAILFGLLLAPYVFEISETIQHYFHVATILVVCIALFSKALTKLIAQGWMKLAEGMGFVMSKVILSAVFYVFLFPISVLYRMFGNDNLRLKVKDTKSFYVERNHTYEKKDLEHQW